MQIPRGWYGWYLEEKAARRKAARQRVEAESLPEDARCTRVEARQVKESLRWSHTSPSRLRLTELVNQ